MLFSDDYTEEVLEQHENEVDRIKDFYANREHIFTKIEKWLQVQKFTYFVIPLYSFLFILVMGETYGI